MLKVSDAWHWFAEAEQLLLNARALVERGWIVDVACQPESPLWQRAQAIGAELHPLPGLRGGNPLSQAANVRRIAHLLDVLQPDVVHAYRSPPHALTAVARLLARHRAPLVRSRGAAQRLRRHPLNLWLYRSAAAVVASSTAVAEDLMKAGVPGARVHVLRGGVDADRVRGGDGAAWRRSLTLEDNTPVLGMLARIDEVKGHRGVVDAMVELDRRGLRVQLLCAGEAWGQSGDRLRQHLVNRGMQDRVRLLGRVDDVAGFLAAVDVVVVGSLGSEAIARALLEAMAAGRPVVATRVGVIPEILERGLGMLVEPGDPSALASALEELLHDPARCAELGEAAAQHVGDHYTLARLAERLERIYRQARDSAPDDG